MDKSIIKAICLILNEKVNRIHYGYEMDCLISMEFTPSPDYEAVFDKAQEICQQRNWSYMDFTRGLYDLVIKDKDPKNGWNIYRETYYMLINISNNTFKQ